MKRITRVLVPVILSITAALSFFPGQAGDRSMHRPLSGGITAETSELAPWIERFSADRRSLDRHYDLAFSPERFDRFEAFLQEWFGQLDRVDFNGLSPDGRIDFLLFKNLLDRERNALQKERQAVRDALSLLPYAESILALARDLKRMNWIEGRDAAAGLNEIRAEAARDEWALAERSKADKTAMRQAVSMAASLRRSLKDWVSFYKGYDPLFTWWATETYEAADNALQSHETALRRVLGEGRSGETVYAIQEPVGRGVLLEELGFEFIPYTPEEILAIGWKELEWCEKERLAASREMGFGDDWMKAMDRVKAAHVDPGGQPELIRFLAFEAIDFLEEHDAVTIPPLIRELIRMDMMPLDRQATTPFFTGGEVISVAYPADVVPFERKISTLRGNNPHFSRAVVHHELVPGHNLQGFMAARHRTYRRPFQTSFYGEGWPLYWEMRLWDMGFQRSPEDRIGMLFWRMHRCARIIFSMSYHLGKMSVDEAIDLLVDRVGHERTLAEVEVKAHLAGRAYGGRPLTQISYLTGGLQLRALSKELVDSGRMTAREFHDAVLKENSIPIELLRAKLVGLDLTSDYRAGWKFYAALLPAPAFQETPDPIRSRIEEGLRSGKIAYRLTEPIELESLFGPPQKTRESKDGGYDLLDWDYHGLSVRFGRMRSHQKVFILLAMTVEGESVDIGRDRKLVLRTTGDLEKIDGFQGLAGVSLERLDLRGFHEFLDTMSFDNRTEWPSPDRLPEGFDPERILENAAAPGLGVRALHRKGIDGRGIGLAIIDQPLLLGHQEYSRRLARYDATGLAGMPPQMHASPVASIAVGRTLGVAPAAALSFFAVPTWKRDNEPYIRALRAILALNATLPADEKIRVVSISTGMFSAQPRFEEWKTVLAEAGNAGILVVTCDRDVFPYGILSLETGANPDDPTGYVRGRYSGDEDLIRVPGQNRTVAGHLGEDVYTFDRQGGLSWGAPYIAGLAALAIQVDPSLTPEGIRETLVETARRTEAGPVVDPAVFIEKVKTRRSGK